MNRILASIRNDITIQFRAKLYAIGIGVGLLVAIIIAFIFKPEHLSIIVPSFILLVIGGSTMLYVAGLIVIERDEGTINTILVSPLKISEYLWSKIITLSGLATLESILMIGGATLILSLSNEVILPNIALLLLGIIAIGIIYTLIGIILIVRYEKITEFLIPLAAVAMILQAPVLYFLGLMKYRVFLIIPTSAPTMLMQGAYIQLSLIEWLYAFGYTSVVIVVLAFWADRAFKKHLAMGVM